MTAMNTITTFYAKNLTGEIKEISYSGKVDEIPTLLTQAFGETPLYEPIWLDDEGYEFVVPRNGQTLLILYRYIPVNVKFIIDYSCYEEKEERITNYNEMTLLIESKYINYLYEEIVIFFYSKKDQNIFYPLEGSNIYAIDENYGGNIKQISIPSKAVSFSSIKDLFLSYKYKFENIPEGFFYHIADCVDNKWKDLK